MDLNDTPEQSRVPGQGARRGWRRTRTRRRCCEGATDHRRGRGGQGPPRLAARARRGGLRRRDLAARSTAARARGRWTVVINQEIAQGGRARDPRRRSASACSARRSSPTAARSRSSATSRRCCTPTRCGASCSPSRPPAPTWPASSRAPSAGRRQLAPLGPEGVDDQRPLRRLRAAARAHRRGRAQAQGPDDVRRADGRRGRHRPRRCARSPAKPSSTRSSSTTCALDAGSGGRRGQRRLGHRADDADVRAPDDRRRQRGHGLPRRPLCKAIAEDEAAAKDPEVRAAPRRRWRCELLALRFTGYRLLTALCRRARSPARRRAWARSPRSTRRSRPAT